MSISHPAPKGWNIEERDEFSFRVRLRRKGRIIVSETVNSLDEAGQIIRDYETEKFNRGSNKVESKAAQRRAAKTTTVREMLEKRKNVLIEGKGADDPDVHRLNLIMRNPIADLTLAEIESSHVEEFKEARLDDDVSESTVRRDLHTLSAAFSWAKKKGWSEVLKDNPASAKVVEYPPDSEHRNRRLSTAKDKDDKNEETRLLETAASFPRATYLPIMIKIALETGMRQGEIRQIEWHDINREQGYIYLPKTKTKRPRSVPLTNTIERLLFEEWPRRNTRLIKRYKITQPSQVFWATDMSDSGQRSIRVISANAVRIAFRRATAKAKILDLHFHDLRHEATSRLFERYGLSMIEVMAVTGHRYTTMTERYTHLFAQEIHGKMKDKDGTVVAEINNMGLSGEEFHFLKACGKRQDMSVEDILRLLIHQEMSRASMLDV